MFTVCPKCTLTLVVTTVDLRAGQGYVRCGRCANVFNALIALREGDPAGSISDSGSRHIEPPQEPPAQPAFGAGVAFEPEPALETEPEPTAAVDFADANQPEPEAPAESEIELSFESQPNESEDSSLEFDAAATDVSEIFISPSEAENGTTSGNFEAVVLGEELAAEPESELEPASGPEPEPEDAPDFEQADHSHTDTIAVDDWSLLDDDEVPADAESVIEESPLAAETQEITEAFAEAEGEATGENEAKESAWVEEMFAEAEAEAIRVRTSENRTLETEPLDESCEPAVVRAARDVKGVSASSGDTVIAPLLTPPVRRRPAWQYVSSLVVLALALLLQVLHHDRQDLVLNPTFGRMTSKIYGWLGIKLTPRWDLSAYSVKQLGAEAEGSEGTRLRVRLSVKNDSDRVQPLPLLRLTLQDRYGNAVGTRDLEPTEYLPPRAADLRLLEPDQRIDAELHVIDPGKAAINFEIDACLRSDSGNIGCASDARPPAAG